MLTKRKEAILNSIVSGYIDTGIPVASQIIAKNKKVQVSSATIRSEMAGLEEEGYILRPHTSAGSIPSDKGYRYYVEHVTHREALAPQDKQLILEEFKPAELDLEKWVRIAATVLPQVTHNLALITMPKATEVRLKRIEIVSVQELVIMLILIFRETRIIRHLLPLDEPVSQQQLTRMSNKLNDLFEGVNQDEISPSEAELSPIEKRLMSTVKELMVNEEQKNFDEPYLDGLHQLFEQPEFSKAEVLRDLIEVMEARGYLRELVEQVYSAGVQVAIGEELGDASVRHFSLVIAEYGVKGQIKGVTGLLGPTRMDYVKNISAVNFMADLMSHMTEEVYR